MGQSIRQNISNTSDLFGDIDIPYRYPTPLRYAGGKSLAVSKILPLIPRNAKKVASPFIGGGSIEIAIVNELKIPVFAYDLFDLLVNYWQMQLSRPADLAEKLSQMPPTKTEYERVKDILKSHWNKIDGYDGKLSELDAAVYYYFSMQLSYGPGFLGWMSSIYESPKKYQSTINRVRNFSAPLLCVRHGSFTDTIPAHNGDFLYLDPPYFLEGDSKMFRGIYPMRNFPIHHNGFAHKTLAKLLKNHRGGFVLSYNDCAWIRETYKNFEIVEVSWQYTMGQGETRIGANRLARDFDNGNIKHSHELLIIG